MTRKKEIILISFLILIFPLIMKGLLNLPERIYFREHSSFLIKWELGDLWWFLLYGSLGVGLLRLNNIARWLVIVYMTGLAVIGPIAMLAVTIIVDKQIMAGLIDKYGIFYIQILPWMGSMLMSVFCGGIAIYLMHPKIRENFSGKRRDNA